MTGFGGDDGILNIDGIGLGFGLQYRSWISRLVDGSSDGSFGLVE